MSRDVVVQAVFEHLQQKYDLSDLEKDIMSTLSKYNEQPFDRKGTEQKVVENNRKYPRHINCNKNRSGNKCNSFFGSF